MDSKVVTKDVNDSYFYIIELFDISNIQNDRNASDISSKVSLT